jgi:hypothetical protein
MRCAEGQFQRGSWLRKNLFGVFSGRALVAAISGFILISDLFSSSQVSFNGLQSCPRISPRSVDIKKSKRMIKTTV